MKIPIKITQDHVRQAILNNEFPECKLTLFNTPFTFIFTDRTPPSLGGLEQLHFMQNILKCGDIMGSVFIPKIAFVAYKELLKTFLQFQTYVGTRLFEELLEYVETGESRNYWELFKAAGPAAAITVNGSALNVFQQKWVLLNVAKDKRDNAELISHVFDALKPWLNTDLFVKVNESTQNQRENINYSDDDMAAEDARIRAKARQLAQQGAKKDGADIDAGVDDDLDEISVDGE